MVTAGGQAGSGSGPGIGDRDGGYTTACGILAPPERPRTAAVCEEEEIHMSSVVVVGSFNVDHVWRCETLPVPGATVAGRYSSGPGGKGFNQAIAAARAGAATTFVCALGGDAGGAMARGLAEQDGVRLVAEPSDEPTGTGGIYVDNHGRNTIVIGPGANFTLSPGFIAAQQPLLAGAQVVLAQLESPLESIEAAISAAHAAGATTILNPAPANAVASIWLLRQSQILTPNETEFAALLGRHVGHRMEADDVAALDGNTLHGLCRQLLPGGTVVITLGAVGAFVSHEDEQLRGDTQPYYRVAAESAQTVDTTGAGDAFNGALAASLAHAPQAAFNRHVRFANRFAARSTEREGAAASMPRLTPED